MLKNLLGLFTGGSVNQKIFDFLRKICLFSDDYILLTYGKIVGYEEFSVLDLTFHEILYDKGAERLEHCSVELIDWFRHPQANQPINRRNWPLTGQTDWAVFWAYFRRMGRGQGLEALCPKQHQSDTLWLVLLTFASASPFFCTFSHRAKI